MVLAYAACTIITLYLCLDKPKDVGVPTIIPVKTDAGENAIDGVNRFEIERRRPQSWFSISLRLSRYRNPQFSTNLLRPIPNDARYGDIKSALLPKTVLTRMDDGFTIAGMVFGGIHCTAWNFQFPTPAERLLWRVTSVLAASALPLYCSLLLADFHFRRFKFSQLILSVLEIVLMVSYFLARLYLLVEVFRDLCFLPPSGFVGT
ncbi:hypothetical protein EJ04DRAFT_520994 [Polyplosphaeria fusca]|uniref:Uncharacterized protein n=1 Tax=Polyplosphaeria fusca TaxID=682080 RepID=A0A9P4V2R7_9PLEO|nr:hypothetical protein EJ04DRAFT_520994 [Polyplosphaeria fusca]